MNSVKSSKVLHILVISMMVLMFLSITACGKAEDKQLKDEDTEKKYDIEYVFPDDTFISVIEGEKIPIEIIVGFGGENGYEQYSTKEPDTINEYIEAFRSVHIKEEIDEQDRMISVADGIIDYTFVLEGDVKVTLGTDLSEYVTDRGRGIQFHLDNTNQLNDLNRQFWE